MTGKPKEDGDLLLSLLLKLRLVAVGNYSQKITNVYKNNRINRGRVGIYSPTDTNTFKSR